MIKPKPEQIALQGGYQLCECGWVIRNGDLCWALEISTSPKLIRYVCPTCKRKCERGRTIPKSWKGRLTAESVEDHLGLVTHYQREKLNTIPAWLDVPDDWEFDADQELNGPPDRRVRGSLDIAAMVLSPEYCEASAAQVELEHSLLNEERRTGKGAYLRSRSFADIEAEAVRNTKEHSAEARRLLAEDKKLSHNWTYKERLKYAA